MLASPGSWSLLRLPSSSRPQPSEGVTPQTSQAHGAGLLNEAAMLSRRSTGTLRVTSPDNANTRFTRRYPVAGWRSPGRALDFDVLFHSVFHGYLVITYPLDLQPAKRAELRRWVLSRRGERVVATPTRVPGASWFDAAEWGWELRCTRVVPTSAALDQFAARRRI